MHIWPGCTDSLHFTGTSLFQLQQGSCWFYLSPSFLMEVPVVHVVSLLAIWHTGNGMALMMMRIVKPQYFWTTKRRWLFPTA